MAEVLQFDLEQSLGAGDTELDRFLAGVGYTKGDVYAAGVSSMGLRKFVKK
jgi:hypothetical protein